MADEPLLYIPGARRLVWIDCPTPERVATLASELQWHHEEHYTVWNVAGTGEPEYSPEAFGGRVISLKYNGHLCPPVLMLVEACVSIHAWLRADPANVVAIHCRSGRGRSAVVLACVAAFLALHKEAEGPTSAIDWLSRLAQCRETDENALTLPTHRRYLQYFTELLHSGVPASAEHAGCELRGVTLHAFPALSTPPCVQVTSGNRALFNSVKAAEAELPDADIEPHQRVAYSYQGGGGGGGGGGGSAAAAATCPLLHGDCVLTIREQGRSGPLLCRAGFHVDFHAGAGVVRMACRALDGAQSRLPADCFVDLILVPREPATKTDAASGGTAAAAASKGGGGDGRINALGAAVQQLRRAGNQSGAREAKKAWGGAQPVQAVFSLGEEEEDDEQPRQPQRSSSTPPRQEAKPAAKAATPPPRAAAAPAAPAAPAPAPAPAASGAGVTAAAATIAASAAASAAGVAVAALSPDELLTRYASSSKAAATAAVPAPAPASTLAKPPAAQPEEVGGKAASADAAPAADEAQKEEEAPAAREEEEEAEDDAKEEEEKEAPITSRDELDARSKELDAQIASELEGLDDEDLDGNAASKMDPDDLDKEFEALF